MREHDHNAQPGRTTAAAPKNNRRLANAFVAAALLCLLVAMTMLFVQSYRSLRDAILLERIDYVDEISAQIINSQIFMKNEYSETAVNLANILQSENVVTLDDAKKYIISKDEGEVLLMAEDNSVCDLSGRQLSMPNDALTRKMLENQGVTELFTSVNYDEDSWLFAAPIQPKRIGETVYKAVILAVSADEFRDNMTISLLDDRGASYIIGNDGRIKIKPLSENLSFTGYNLFSSMRAQGASESDIALLQAELARGEAGSGVMQADGLDWLVGHTPVDADTSIVVAIPLTLTAAQTYQGLNRTIVLSALSVGIVGLIALLFILRFFQRDRLRQKEALAVAAKSEFFSKMSHDIRTPLNAVIGMVQLANDNSEDPTVKGYLTQSASAAKYLLSIINDVLEVSRIESGKLSLYEHPFDVNAMLSQVRIITEPLAEEKGVAFIEEMEGSITTEHIGDEVRIKQILTNLLSNAIKFTMPGGQVRLRVVCSAASSGLDRLNMTVSDTGIGMSQEYLSRIFTPFEQEQSSYTQQYAGSGLGLSIVHSLVEMMGGTIEVSSQVGEGSAFTVSLPLRRGKALKSHPQPAAERGTQTYAAKRILLAEDNEINQVVAAKILSQKFGVSVDAAPDGEAAVELFSASRPGTYDMVLMDVKMPVMDGLAATRAIRALSRPDARNVPIIALSANAYKEDVELSLSAGMNEHLSKPLDIDALSNVFQKYFH